MSDVAQLGDGPLILHVAGIQRRGRLEHEDVRFFLGDRPVFDATGNNQNLSLFEPDMPIPELHAKPAFDDEEKFVLVVMVVPDKLTEYFGQLHVLAVEFADDLRLPLVAELRQLRCEVHLLHDWLRSSGASRSSCP